MATELLMPKLGLTMTEGTIDEWKKKVGEPVAKGEIIYSVATDKLTNDVEADVDGILLAIAVPEGETVPCKTVVGWVGAAGEAVPSPWGSMFRQRLTQKSSPGKRASTWLPFRPQATGALWFHAM